MIAVCALAAALLAGCSSSTGRAAPNATDRAFLQMMIPHHERAIAVARIGESSASDARVRAFAARIVREQSPELSTMRHLANGLSLDLAAGARSATDRIADNEVAALRRLRGRAFDQQFLRLHITSETGAAAMGRDELHGGAEGASRKLAKSIASAPSTQIPELRRLLTALGG